MKRGKVWIVGAGPGDPELITVKGLRLIREADVIVYDRLVHPALLREARSDAELIYVGKAPGRHTMTQDEINKLLVEKALEGKMVVRLKGGDPYVFGRGEEECAYVIEHGVECEVVPGVSSAVAVPAYAGIPVTSRWCASSFAVVTGMEAAEKEKPRVDYARIAAAVDTIVVLMGVSRLEEITRSMLRGRAGDTPAAVIERGTLPEQRVVVGTLADIASKAREAGIQPPAVLVVGEVVRLRDRLWKLR
ncbi:uroporphyrin-III C-methyltransferase [Pyrolobus fumarii 1A]|uniref:uroporphyrinogen-III C-methyltransferase n=1 Tax=Pyrolobus fumarii (strain DSM 11204 / 1A) TaxID=694429 RepID=G0EGU2_PYRF1|nr:uroporphyrinogen-III C-methyltransferase [Pyrolobus fumarii]AEM39240.1 uroporphyrin-III C-methyltransferase [Pyrolobus fumarii 1A]